MRFVLVLVLHLPSHGVSWVPAEHLLDAAVMTAHVQALSPFAHLPAPYEHVYVTLGAASGVAARQILRCGERAVCAAPPAADGTQDTLILKPRPTSSEKEEAEPSELNRARSAAPAPLAVRERCDSVTLLHRPSSVMLPFILSHSKSFACEHIVVGQATKQ